VRAGILALLAEEPQHGYQLLRQLDERSGGVWRPSPGSVYPTLSQLEDEGLVSSDEVDGRRVFTLTDAGQAEVASHDGPAPWDEVARGATALDVRPMVMAARQVLATGDPAQIEAARKVIAEARRSLYLILAGDEPEG
jgi:DNA-binding PadR family transcriptional regulator